MVRWRMRPPKTIVSGTIGPCLSMFNFYRCGMKGTSCRFSAPIWKIMFAKNSGLISPKPWGYKIPKMVWNQQTFCPRLSRMFETSIHHFRVCNTPQTVGSQNSNCLWGYQHLQVGVPMIKTLTNKRVNWHPEKEPCKAPLFSGAGCQSLLPSDLGFSTGSHIGYSRC